MFKPYDIEEMTDWLDANQRRLNVWAIVEEAARECSIEGIDEYVRGLCFTLATISGHYEAAWRAYVEGYAECNYERGVRLS